jgi:acyl-CoA thioesterase I
VNNSGVPASPASASPAVAAGHGFGQGLAPRRIRVCVVGDDLVAGVGDPRSLGWIGRVGARTSRTEAQVTLFSLGVPAETTAELVGRWGAETQRRFAGAGPEDCRLVVGLGHEDLRQGVSLPRSRLHLANLLDDCSSRGLPVFVVGPPPAPEDWRNGKVAELSVAFADVCLRRAIPYVDCFGPLVAHEDWLTDLAAGDGVHPGQAGYGLMAWLVLHGGWHAWLGLPDPA